MERRARKGWNTVDSLYSLILVGLLAGGIYVTYLGYTDSGAYLEAVPLASVTSFKGVMFGWQPYAPGHYGSLAVKDVTLGIAVALPTNEVDLDVAFEDRPVSDHAFTVVLPFEIHSVRVQNALSVFGSVEALHAYNVSDSSSVLVFTWRDGQNLSSWTNEHVRMAATAVASMVSETRGEYEFYFPLGVYPTQVVIDNASALSPPLTLLAVSAYNATLTVTLPTGSKLEQLIPSTASLEEPTFGSIGEQYGWTFVAPQGVSSVVVNYRNPTEVNSFQNDLFLGGLFLGVGLSLIFAVTLETFRFVHDKASQHWQ